MATEPPVFSKLLQPKKRAFLKALVLAGGNYTRAAQVCKHDRNYHYYWKASDELYRAEHERAIELATDRLEDEMLRRAYQGVKRPIMHAGKQAQVFAVDEDGNPIKDESGKYKSVPAVLTEYDTTLMIFALKARRPEKYRERVEQKIVGADGGPVTVQIEYVDGNDTPKTPTST